MASDLLFDQKIEDQSEKKTLQSLLDFSCLAKTESIPNNTIVRCEVTSADSAKLLYYIAITYKGTSKPLPSGTPSLTLPISEVNINR